MLITNPNTQLNNSVYAILKNQQESKDVLLVFNHGLGDLINFLPLFDALVDTFKGKHKIVLGASGSRGFKDLDIPNMVDIWTDNINDLDEFFDIVFVLNYPDANNNTLPKPILCNYKEIGLPIFHYNAYKFNCITRKEKITNRVGVNFFGNTGNRQKSPTPGQAKIIWNEIKSLGLEPFEIHMRPNFIVEKIGNEADNFPLVNKTNSIRFERPNLKIMIDAILTCDYFIGIDAGPLYLAVSLLSKNRCLGLQKVKVIENYLPINLSIVDIRQYDRKGVGNWLKEKYQNEYSQIDDIKRITW